MFALIVKVEILVIDLRYVRLNAVSEILNKTAPHTHFCDVTLVGLLDRLFIPLLINQIDEAQISVQRDLLLEMTARGLHLDDRFNSQQQNSRAR
jgi:hypothetical protein